MKPSPLRIQDSIQALLLALFMALALGLSPPASAEVANISDVPLANSPTDAVRPNLMYILDDSGSMLWDYMPDNIFKTTNNYVANNCKTCTSSACTINGRQCAVQSGNVASSGDAPYFSTQFNQIYYNPDITYNPAVTSGGVSMGNVTPTAAYDDMFLDNRTYTNLITASPAVAPKVYYCNTPTPTASNLNSSSKCQQVTNLVNYYPETYYCNTSTPTAANLADTSKCRRNGIDNVSGGYFMYFKNDATNGGYPYQSGSSTTSFNNRVVSFTSNPYYFTIAAHEYCSDTNLTTCQLANSDGSAPSGFTIAAPVRYCGTTSDSSSASAVSGNSGSNARCRKKFDQTSYPYPRYGRFTRTDIVPTTATYTKGPLAVRTDCANASYCTYAEELQNFANWWGYYRTRMQTMKTATGRAFLPIDDRYRVGFITINPNNPVSSDKYLKIDTFASSQKDAWYTLLYQQTSNGGTPLREALSRIGRHYAGIKDTDTGVGINNGMINASNPDPLQYSCQQNFALLTTDGYYKDTTAEALTMGPNPITSGTATPYDRTATTVGNTDAIEDTVDPIYVSRASGTLDGQGSKATIVTPATTTEQVICTANNNTAFTVLTGGTQQACGCTGIQTRVWQRDFVETITVSTTEGTQTGSSSAYTNTFSPITGCTTPLVVTTVTAMEQFEDAVCSASATTTYAAGTQQACGCAANTHKMLTRRATYNNTVVTTDGVQTSNTNGALTYSFLAVGATGSNTTACVSSVIQTDTRADTQTETQPCTVGETVNFSIGGSVACTSGNAALGGVSLTAGNRGVVQVTVTTNYSRTVVDGVIGAFSQTGQSFAYSISSAFAPPVTKSDTYTITATQGRACSGSNSVTGYSIGTGANADITNCGCSGTRSTVWTRTATATYTLNYTDGALTSTSALSGWTVSTDSPAQTGGSCKSSAQSNVAVKLTPTGANTSTPSGGTKTATGTNSGPPSVTYPASGTGSKVVGSLVTGTIVLGSASGTALTITRSPNPSVAAAQPAPAGTPAVSNNGGTTVAITLSPNPNTVAGTTTTTQTAGGTSNTLADVAMYYYKTDLRPCPGGTPQDGTCLTDPLATDNVPNTSKDFAITQHMTTFTLGLGLQGSMDYTSDYESNSTSDLSKIKTSSTNCAFSVGVCDWPAPVAGDATTLDDLWHAAVNGRGTYYSASDPNSLANGLASALSALHIQTAAASASATSSPNITQTDNFIYSSTFRTVKWDGEVVAQQIDTSTGNVLSAIVWSAQAQVDAKVTPNSDTRAIYAFQTGATNNLVPFIYANLLSAAAGSIAAEQPYFSNVCDRNGLTQCALLPIGDKAIANSGDNLVNYLRGQTQYQGAAFRARDHALGDPINATPAFIKAPTFGFIDAVTPTYASFKAGNASRAGMLYIAANDGMLHAFDGSSGDEKWAFVPRMVMPNMYKLATDNWDVSHSYMVDGSPQIMDVYDNRTDPAVPVWKTILVGGLNKGGRGYYALDITSPTTPKGLWQTCSDSTLCENSDADFGYSYGNPVIAKRASDGRWVVIVTSGLDNVTGSATGRGFLYVLDAFTGAILRKVDTGVGDTTTPSGLNKISAFANSFNTDNTAAYIYGGDLLGNVWRFDMSTDPPTKLQLATLKDSTGKPQSITTRPELSIISGNRVVFVGTGRYLGTDDLYDPSSLSPALQWAYTQSVYALKDKGTAYGDPRSGTPGLVEQVISDTGTTSRTISSHQVVWTTKDGWYADFNPGGTSPGERVNIDPQLIQGTLFVKTNVPNNSACTVGGDNFSYQFDFSSGKAVSSSTGGVVATKTVGQISVGVVIFRRPSGVFTGVDTGATGTKTTIGINIGGGGGSGRRVSWRELIR